MTIRESTDKNGRGIIKVNLITANGIEIKVVREIFEHERKNKNLIGSPVGVNMEHCLIMAKKYAPNQFNDIKYYYENKNDTNPLLETLRSFQNGLRSYELYGDRK